MEERLTVPEAARYLRLAEPTIRGMISDGRLPHIKISRRVFLWRHDLDQILTDGYVPARREAR